MRIFITGGTGFVGTYIVRHLIQYTNHSVKLLIHSRKSNLENHARVEYVYGSVLDQEALEKDIEDCDAVIHLVGIIREKKPDNTFDALHVQATGNIVNAMQKLGISRLVHMSALGVDAGIDSNYFKTKLKAEDIVKNSGLTYTIFRPSIVWGNEGFKKDLEFIINIPFISPIVDSGKTKFQPVDVKDLASQMVESIQNEAVFGKTIEVGGPSVYTFEQLVYKLEHEQNKKKLHIHIPLSFIYPFFRLTERVDIPFPVTEDQLKMLLTDNIVHTSTHFIGEIKIFGD